jgi:ATP-dependent helicase/nuclease subunit B
VQNPEALVYSQFPHLAHGRRALAQRASTAFTAFDGDVPQAGAYLDPTSEAGMVLSASRLQTLAACPRRFFFQYGLGIEPPDELAIDPERWLDALAFGSLLHELFDQFLRELASEKRGPDFKRDSNQLKYLLELLVARYKEKYPPPSDSAFERDCSRLEQTAEIFLRQEAQFCAETQCTPMFFEASLGMQPIGPGSRLDSLDPVPIELNSGKVIRVRGRIDRVDELGIPAAQTFGIWDYKTGSDWGYSQGDPFDQGRKIQPYLYVTIVAHRLRQQIGPQAQVAHFGFFFPGTRAAGQRFQWTPDQLQGGAEIVEHLCDLLRSGTFVATNNSDDCKWCDYRAVCGDVELVAAQTQSKLADVKNRNLRPFVHLRPIES